VASETRWRLTRGVSIAGAYAPKEVLSAEYP
jgi:hypothetical protein